MFIKAVILPNTYSDSMTLMALSTKVNELPTVEQAMIGMGTDLNKQVIDEVGLSTPEVEAAGPRDQIIVIQAADEAAADEAFDQVEELRAQGMGGASQEKAYRTSRQAYENEPDVNLTLISVPGEYAAAEAMAALDADRNVIIFSDNVAVEDEIALKNKAHDKGLLVMGPDCGTAIINGTALAFANVVSEGPIGIIAASGTGSQEVSVQIDALGSGITQLVGVGGRDLSEEVGGIMMLDAMAMLGDDEDTKVLVIISKPPAPSVAAKVLKAAGQIGKPVVACFIGDDSRDELPDNVFLVDNTRDAARKAVELTGKTDLPPVEEDYGLDYEAVKSAWTHEQKYLRGLFCGGTVCDEVYHAVKAVYPQDTYSNVAKDPDFRLERGEIRAGHDLVDLGSDEYTRGRPHPMIDPTLRNAEIIKQAQDGETAVIALDFELGYGASSDPVGQTAEAITQAQAVAEEASRPLEIVGYVLGTDKDPQGRAGQVNRLEDLGVTVVSNVQDLATVSLRMLP